MERDLLGNIRVTMETAVINPSDAYSSAFVAAGKCAMYMASTGAVAVGLASNLRMMLANPAGAAKPLSLVRLVLFGVTTLAYARVVNDPKTNLPTTLRPSNCTNLGGAGGPSAGTVYADAGAAMTGASDSGLDIPLPVGVFSTLDLPPLYIQPGHAFGLNVPYTASAGGACFLLFWHEN